jgi:Holliday junction resolvase
LKPESKFWKEWKAFTPNILWTRIENMSSLGTPDLLGYNKNKTFFTVELKVTKGNSVSLSPHQMSFHIRHPENTFILVKSLASSISKLDDKKLDNVKLYEGKNIKELAARGLQLDACCLGLDACRLHLENL